MLNRVQHADIVYFYTMRIHELISEIKRLKDQPVHTSTLSIYNMLENNKTLFLRHLDATDYAYLLSAFESLSQSMPREYGSAGYVREYERAHGLLCRYLDQIL